MLALEITPACLLTVSLALRLPCVPSCLPASVGGGGVRTSGSRAGLLVLHVVVLIRRLVVRHSVRGNVLVVVVLLVLEDVVLAEMVIHGMWHW